jgi:hypothetical protein
MSIEYRDTDWVCDACQLYGTRHEAEAHAAVEGHTVRELDPTLTAAVRAERSRAQMDRAAAYLHMIARKR